MTSFGSTTKQRTVLYSIEAPAGVANGVSWRRWSTSATNPPGGVADETWDSVFTGAPVDGIPQHPNAADQTGIVPTYFFDDLPESDGNGKDHFELDAYVWVPDDVQFSDTSGRAEVGAVFKTCCGGTSEIVSEWAYVSPYRAAPWECGGGFIRLTTLVHDYSAWSQFRLAWDLGGSAAVIPAGYLWPTRDAAGNELPCPKMVCTPVGIDCSGNVCELATDTVVGTESSIAADPFSQLDCPYPMCDAVGGGSGDSGLSAEEAKVIAQQCIDDQLPKQIEYTCAALESLANAGGIEPGCEYIVTDYNRGTVGAATIRTHGVTTTAVSHDVSVLTTFDDSAWFGRWDPETHRIYDLFDNLGNKVRSDTGDEIERFPWGNALVTGNEFTDFDLNYTAGTVRDNFGGPTARLDVNDGNVQQNHFSSLADVRVSGAGTLTRTNVSSRGRIVQTGGLIQESEVSGYSYVQVDKISIYRTEVRALSYLYSNGATGRIDNTTLQGNSQIDVRNAVEVNIDELALSGYGRVLAGTADLIRINDVEITSGSYSQTTAGERTTLSLVSIEGGSYIRTLNGELEVQRTSVSAYGRIDQNSTGSNLVRYSTVDGGYITFTQTATNNRVDWSHAGSNGLIRFRGTTSGHLVSQSSATARGYLDYLNVTNGVTYYVTVATLSYAYLQNITAPMFQYSTFDGYGRMLWDGGNTGTVIGISLEGTAFLRLSNHASSIRHSSFDSYFYYYLTGSTAVKSGLQGSGRQSYTEPNPGTTVTGAGVRNW